MAECLPEIISIDQRSMQSTITHIIFVFGNLINSVIDNASVQQLDFALSKILVEHALDPF